jgi:predicted RNA-binding protein with PUA-like domain
MAYWLMKSEPDVFSIDDLAAAPQQTTCWDGVRNYQARNFMRSMQLGDQVFFYHSNATPSSIVGIAEVVQLAYPDATALDPTDPHYDPKATPQKPIWEMVDLRFVEKFPRPLSLEELRSVESLEEMELLRRGSRLSVQPVTPQQWKTILQLARGKRS